MAVFGRSGKKRPATLVGLWLRAGALRLSREQRAPLLEELDRTGWIGAEAVAEAACELAVEAAYAPGNATFDVPEFLKGIREFFSVDGKDKFPQREGEMLVRAALGETVDTQGIDRTVAFTVHGLVFTGVMLAQRNSEAELERFLSKAEEVAISRGFSPTMKS